jgi:hypothetical protein
LRFWSITSGKAAQGPDDLKKADEFLTAAITLAREQGSRLMELRALCSKAEFWMDKHPKGAMKAGHDLRELHAGFNEGHQTPDLVKAPR